MLTTKLNNLIAKTKIFIKEKEKRMLMVNSSKIKSRWREEKDKLENAVQNAHDQIKALNGFKDHSNQTFQVAKQGLVILEKRTRQAEWNFIG